MLQNAASLIETDFEQILPGVLPFLLLLTVPSFNKWCVLQIILVQHDIVNSFRQYWHHLLKQKPKIMLWVCLALPGI
jgi:hypothetical protein